MCYLKNKELGEALSDFRQEFKLSSSRRTALSHIVRVLCSMEDFDEAIKGEDVVFVFICIEFIYKQLVYN